MSTFFGNSIGALIKRVLGKLGLAKKSEHVSILTSMRQDPDAAKMTSNDFSYEIAKEFSKDLQRLILQQSFAWVPLSSGYAERKRMLGMDPRTLIASGRYVNSIQPVQQEDGSWIVGVPPEPLGGSSDKTLQDLARWLEFGTRSMPPRPHWRPALRLWSAKSYRIKQLYKEKLVRDMRAQGFK